MPDIKAIGQSVVYLYIPTSNHNLILIILLLILVVYLYIPTSNHNVLRHYLSQRSVVYLYIPTSNHNRASSSYYNKLLYIFIFLHQTTTSTPVWSALGGCISLYSYIKPQPTTLHLFLTIGCISLYSYIKPQRTGVRGFNGQSCISLYSYIKPQRPLLCTAIDEVVYLYIPTSNHNDGR